MSVSARASAAALHGAPVGDGADGDGNACEQARPPPSPAAPLRMDANNPPEVSLRCVLPFLHLLEQAHGTDAIDAIVERAGRVVGISDISYSALRRSSPDDVWVSIAFLDALRDSMFADIYGMNGLPPRTDPLWQLWRQAGVFSCQKEMLGSVLFPILKTFGSPSLLYKNLPFSLRKGNTVLSCEILNSSAGKIEVSMKPHKPETYKEGHEFCLNRIGSLEGAPLIWGLNKAQVEHTRCMHDPVNPAHECTYIIRFEGRRLVGIAKSVLGLIACIFIAIYCVPLSREQSLVSGLVLYIGWEGWRRYLQLHKLYQQDTKHMRDLIDRYDRRYMDLWKESDELRRLTLDNRNISAYVPPSLLHRLRCRREQSPRLGGTKIDATIVFVDIRNYSTLAERLDPEQTLNVLNECFSAWVKDVQSYGGTVLEFLGDGMLAVFGAPNDVSDHPAQAVKCLRTMMGTMERLNESWEVTGGIRHVSSKPGSSRLGFRAGIHTGTVIAGNLGSLMQMKYAVVGDTVNVAARLEQLNKSLGTVIAVSGETYAHLPKYLKKMLRPKGHHFVKGRDQAVDVYTHGSPSLPAAAKRFRRLSLPECPKKQ